MKRVYNHKIKEGAKKKMRSVVKMMFWQTFDALEEGAICCITQVSHPYSALLGLGNNFLNIGIQHLLCCIRQFFITTIKLTYSV